MGSPFLREFQERIAFFNILRQSGNRTKDLAYGMGYGLRVDVQKIGITQIKISLPRGRFTSHRRNGDEIQTLSFFIIVILCFIWGNSMMPASVSGDFSSWVKSLFNQIAGIVGSGGLHGVGLLRKAAHMSEFAVLGAVFTLFLYEKKKARCFIGESSSGIQLTRKQICAAVAFGFVAACTDEVIQLLPDGRSSEFRDVCIDILGYTAGILVTAGLIKIKNIFTKSKKIQ